jgi:aconitate hydratase
MLAAGLLAQKAAERGLKPPAYVKTSLAPGSKVVSDYLQEAGVMPALESLGFDIVGYGCTTCIGNSGPLPEAVAGALNENPVVAAAVLSGNRNFEGRIHPQVKANYLSSPPLVVAFALAGTVDIDLNREPLGRDPQGRPVHLRDIWPSRAEVDAAMQRAVRPEMFRRSYANIWDGNPTWNAVPVSGGDLYDFKPESTYIQEPPFFTGMTRELPPLRPIRGARVLALFGDSITTDHISPAGDIALNSPAGKYLSEHGVEKRDFNSYGSRRGNDRVMVRGTFANIRLKNLMLPGTEGGVTLHLPDREQMTIYDAAMRYQSENVPLLVIAGKEYGAGSSRDWAAKGTLLLGVRAVIAETYERIHRSNLVGMGVLPLVFNPGESAASLGLTGEESYDVEGLASDIRPRQELTVTATAADGSRREFQVIARLDSQVDVDYYRNGGILQTVLRSLARTA